MSPWLLDGMCKGKASVPRLLEIQYTYKPEFMLAFCTPGMCYGNSPVRRVIVLVSLSRPR